MPFKNSGEELISSIQLIFLLCVGRDIHLFHYGVELVDKPHFVDFDTSHVFPHVE